MPFGNKLIKTYSLTEAGAITLPADASVLVGANGADVVVSVTIDSVVFTAEGSPIANGTCKKITDFLPQDTVLSFDNACKVLVFPAVGV